MINPDGGMPLASPHGPCVMRPRATLVTASTTGVSESSGGVDAPKRTLCLCIPASSVTEFLDFLFSRPSAEEQSSINMMVSIYGTRQGHGIDCRSCRLAK